MPFECGHGQTQVRVFEPLLRQTWHALTGEAVCAYCHGEPSGADGCPPGQLAGTQCPWQVGPATPRHCTAAHAAAVCPANVQCLVRRTPTPGPGGSAWP